MNAAVPVFALPPEVTTERVDELEPLLAAETAASDRVVVDLGAVLFLCSSGLGMLVKASKGLHERGGGLVLARPQPGVARLLRMVGLSAVLPVHPTIEAAAAALARLPARAGP